MALTLYRNGSIYSSADPFATAMLVDGNTVAWLGSESAADRQAQRADAVIDLEGGLITPAFVESHAHLADLGAVLAGADVSVTRSAADLLDAVHQRAALEAGHVTGHGWDETRWEDPTLPTAAQLDEAGNGKAVYLARVDKHSALVNDALLQSLGLEELTAGLVSGSDHQLVCRRLQADAPLVAERQRRALAHYAQRGFATVVEMGAEHLSGAQSLAALLALEDAELPAVYGYWGESVADAGQAREVAAQFPAERFLGLGGDLLVDGSLGSRTAALRAPYADAPQERGKLYLDAEQIAAHLIACTEARIQAGFHVIGDAALDTVLEGFDRAAQQVGVAALQGGRHRLEHVEMVDEAGRRRLLEYSITVSMQPRFDEYWGGEQGMYATRLGEQRAGSMNDLAAMLSAGVPLVLGSDAPVTEVDGWAVVRAAMSLHHTAGRISARAAFLAQTRAAYRAMGVMNPYAGQLVIGAPATFAVWSASQLAVQTPDERISSWSTDARAGTPLLPVVDEEIPRCLRTVREGVTLYDALTVTA